MQVTLVPYDGRPGLQWCVTRNAGDAGVWGEEGVERDGVSGKRDGGERKPVKGLSRKESIRGPDHGE